MKTDPHVRSVKIGEQERTGWSSDRPRSAAADGSRAPRPFARRCRRLLPTEQLIYRPGSTVVIAADNPQQARGFASRVLRDGRAIIDLAGVQDQLNAKFGEEDAAEKLHGLVRSMASGRRLQTVLIAASTRVDDLRLAAAAAGKAACHLVFLDPGRDASSEAVVLRGFVQRAELGADGFSTCLGLTANAASAVRGLLFSAPDRDS